MDEIIYANSLDRGAWHLRVWGLVSDRYRGILQVSDKSGHVVHQQYVSISYGAPFGPDAGDVLEWHQITLDVIDHPENRHGEL